VCQDIAETLDEGDSIDAIKINFSKAFNLVPHDRHFTKLAAWGVDSKGIVWVRELLVGRTEMVRVGKQLSEEVEINSLVPHRNVLGTLEFIVYVNDIWRNIESSIRIFADICKIIGKLQIKTI